MFPIKIVIPGYLKEVKLSEAQRPIYWVWDNVAIRAKRKPLLQKYIAVNRREAVIMNNGKATPADLREEYHIAVVLDNKVLLKINKDIHISNIEIIRAALVNGTTAVKITEKQATRLKFFLVNQNDEPIVDNVHKVGQPKYIKIKGQDIYSGNVREFTRAEIMRQIKDSFYKYLQDVPPITKFPLKIEMELHTPIKLISDKSASATGIRWDVDNHAFPYVKAFSDALRDMAIIPDDDRLHVTIPPHAVYCPCVNETDRKLVFIITHDDREIILNNKFYE